MTPTTKGKPASRQTILAICLFGFMGQSLAAETPSNPAASAPTTQTTQTTTSAPAGKPEESTARVGSAAIDPLDPPRSAQASGKTAAPNRSPDEPDVKRFQASKRENTFNRPVPSSKNPGRSSPSPSEWLAMIDGKWCRSGQTCSGFKIRRVAPSLLELSDGSIVRIGEPMPQQKGDK